MTLDEKLLREAKTTRDRLIELELKTDRTRASYQHAIRRLHAAGGSLREIAEALGLSHQRVHQIVEVVAGKVAFKEMTNALLHCTFCGRPQNEVEKLIAGPGVYICNDCVGLSHSTIAAQIPRTNEWTELADVTSDPQSKCNFCGKSTRQVEHMVVGVAFPKARKKSKYEKGPFARICNECLDLCDRILAGTFSSDEARARGAD